MKKSSHGLKTKKSNDKKTRRKRPAGMSTTELFKNREIGICTLSKQTESLKKFLLNEGVKLRSIDELYDLLPEHRKLKKFITLFE